MKSSPRPNTVSGLSASVRQLSGELQARTKERDDARAALARTKFLLSALERSYGTRRGADRPANPERRAGGRSDKWEKMTGEEASAFYRNNRDAILAAQSARQQRNWK